MNGIIQYIGHCYWLLHSWGGLRWRRSKKQSSPPSADIENTYTSRIIHTEQLLSADRRPQMSEKTRKPPCNWVGQKKKEKEGIRVGPASQGESSEGGKVPAPWEGSSPAEKLDWMEGGVLEPKKGRAATSFWKAKQRITCTTTLCDPN